MKTKNGYGAKKRKFSFIEEKKRKTNKMFCRNIAGVTKKSEEKWEEIKRYDIIGLVETCIKLQKKKRSIKNMLEEKKERK